MKSFSEFEAFYLHRAPVDMRKSINGLSVIVQEEMKLDLQSSALFLFCNRRRTHLKILYYDRNGFALWFKRLEESKFPWPKNFDQEVILMREQDLELLLDGINLWTKFKEVSFETVI